MDLFLRNETHPALFGILPLYGIIVFIGGLAVVAWSYIEWNRKGYRTWDYTFLASWTFIFAIYGAKIWYMIFDPANAFYGVNNILSLLTVIFIPAFGRSIMGTIVFVPIGIILWQKYWGAEYKTLEIMDIIIPAFFIGQAIGRWGNFVNHEIYGSEVTLQQINWLPNFIIDNMFIDGAYRQPLFLYESIMDLISFILIITVIKNIKKFQPGTSTSVYFILYGLNRSIFELMRDDEFIMKWFDIIPTTFVVAIIMFIFGIVLFIFLNLKWKEKENGKQ